MACSADERYLIRLSLDDDFPSETFGQPTYHEPLGFAMYSFV